MFVGAVTAVVTIVLRGGGCKKRGSLLAPTVVAAALSAVRCVLFAVPQSYYAAHIHAVSSGGSCALDLFPEVLYLVAIWLFFLFAYVHMRREALTAVANIVPASAASIQQQHDTSTPLLSASSSGMALAREMASTATRLERLPGAGALGSFKGMVRRSELRQTRVVGAVVAGCIPLAAAIVSLAVGLLVPSTAANYETVDIVVAVFRAVAAFALFACLAVCIGWFPQRRAALALCSLPVFLHGTFAAFDFKLRMPTVSCSAQYLVWGTYFLVSELPLYILLQVIIVHFARETARLKTVIQYRSSFVTTSR